MVSCVAINSMVCSPLNYQEWGVAKQFFMRLATEWHIFIFIWEIRQWWSWQARSIGGWVREPADWWGGDWWETIWGAPRAAGASWLIRLIYACAEDCGTSISCKEQDSAGFQVRAQYPWPTLNQTFTYGLNKRQPFIMSSESGDKGTASNDNEPGLSWGCRSK